MIGSWLTPLRRRILDRLILRPSSDPIECVDGVMQSLPPREGDRAGVLSCHRLRRRPADRVVVYKFPGNAGRAERSSEFPLSILGGGTAWTWNPPGYGSSDGPSRLDGYAEAAMEFVQRAESNSASFDESSTTPIVLYGNSMGCCAATFVASKSEFRHRIAGLVLRNPPPLAKVVMRVAEGYPMGRWIHSVANSLPPSMDIELQVSSISSPIIWLSCQDDSLVPPDLQRAAMDQHLGETVCVTLDGLDHNDAPEQRHQASIEDALTKHLVNRL